MRFVRCAIRGALIAASLVSLACGANGDGDSLALEDSADAIGANRAIAPDTATRTLAYAAGASAYRIDDAPIAGGSLAGTVQLLGVPPVDSIVTPDRDSTGCAPFLDVTVPRERGARRPAGETSATAVGNAVVWLVGVTHGPRVDMPRRVSMVLDGCHFDPRVMVAPVGATLLLNNRDDLIADLQLIDHDAAGQPPRETIGFTDPGQLVPSSKALAMPGLVDVRDSRQPWIRGFVAVAPHPFVAVTEADGKFLFDGVPAGSYQLVVWHERLGARVMSVRIERGVATIVTVEWGEQL